MDSKTQWIWSVYVASEFYVLIKWKQDKVANTVSFHEPVLFHILWKKVLVVLNVQFLCAEV